MTLEEILLNACEALEEKPLRVHRYPTKPLSPVLRPPKQVFLRHSEQILETFVGLVGPLASQTNQERIC